MHHRETLGVIYKVLWLPV